MNWPHAIWRLLAEGLIVRVWVLARRASGWILACVGRRRLPSTTTVKTPNEDIQGSVRRGSIGAPRAGREGATIPQTPGPDPLEPCPTAPPPRASGVAIRFIGRQAAVRSRSSQQLRTLRNAREQPSTD